MMESNPDPLGPEIRRAARLDPSTRAHGLADFGVRTRGKAYTEKPQIGDTPPVTSKRKKRRVPLLAIAFIAAALVSGFIWKQEVLPHWMHPWTAVQQEQILTLTPADVDYAATDAARAALARGEIPPVLANADVATRENILSGKENLYTKRLLQQNQNGILVHARVSTGGVFLGEDLLTAERPQGTTFPAGPGAPTHFHFTAEQTGPNGVVSCWVKSVNGGVVTTRPMAAGDSADLEVIAQ
ncbi:MAG TPA: hypothetical protein VHT01_08550 [Candidatus Udaeobacter sp.]|jgi:hypothetical protein|nr:hypothetical protein [Candidatus Udaeobacter sp.]